MFQPTARDTIYPITTNKTGYSSTTVLRRNGNAGDKKIAYQREVSHQILSQAIQLFRIFMAHQLKGLAVTFTVNPFFINFK